ncbi:MAG: ATP synthase F1 subunit epsilon [Crocinitomicaceae bacterium]|jgi:F-type H+-transporting ATPase subunit epsilon|nr:ATP synthase F1 subunit epsilon [Crocinitomicaceae bacterium]MBT5403630.1 ATP synthase F1 subunit epsilon [Crocinitomicaceae bacterium]MBT6030878.1 ATP synthase F1 subunit epsilon [Crocinitomicaceae bacterium]MBT6513760.1 ATP synthase F1 subunit epsilon [Crocinitomicaceae bacterium]
MRIEILTPDQELYSGEGSAVYAPGKDGSLGILENHAALITSLRSGKVEVVTPNGRESFDVDGGVLEVLNNKVIILAE